VPMLALTGWQTAHRPKPVHRERLAWTQAVALPNGTRILLDPAPVVRAGRTAAADRILIGIRLCAGTGEGDDERNRSWRYLDPTNFSLRAPDGSIAPPSLTQFADRLPPTPQYVPAGRCASGWLTYVPVTGPATGYELRWASRVTGDRGSWRLPGLAAVGPRPSGS
jgi:hypothetical protein